MEFLRARFRTFCALPLALASACVASGRSPGTPVPAFEIETRSTIAADSLEIDPDPLQHGSAADSPAPTPLQSKLVRGRLLAPDRDRWDGLLIFLRTAWRIDSANLSPSGEFDVALADITADSAEVIVRGTSGNPTYHPTRIEFGSAISAPVVLVPTRWTIRSGAYAGRSVRISPGAAIARSFDRSRFARIHRIDGTSIWKSVGWRAKDFPLPLVFARDPSGPTVSPDDSSALWLAVRLLEHDLGAELFRPAGLGDVMERDARVIVRIDPELTSSGVTSVAWGPPGNLMGVEVAFRSVAKMHDRGIAMHELLHTLGFGHTSSWNSLMRSGGHGRTSRATPDDVAYVQMLLGLRELQAASGALDGLMSAVIAQHGR